MVTIQDYTNEIRPTWCPGCGDYGIWNALKRGFVKANLAPHEIMMVTGIGCGSKMNDYMHINGLNTLHGRALAVATGFKLANPAMKVIVVHGDGDGYGEGGNHFMHSARRNIGLVDLVENNHVYGLTKGQYSPTSRAGFVTPTSPSGALERPMKPLALALTQGATFVARGFSLDINGLADLVAEAMGHRGYALLEMLQPCVSFNRHMDYDWYRERIYSLSEAGHDPTDQQAAIARALEFPGGERIPTGVFYRTEDTPSYEEQVVALHDGPVALGPVLSRPREDYRALLQTFM